MESAYNSKTGESLFLVDDEWVAPESTATNPKTGERAFLVNNEWQIKPALPTFVSAEEEAAASKPSFVNPIIAKEAKNIRRIQQQRVPPKPVATPIAAVEQPPYKSRQEALDDAVNLLEENQNPERIKSSFEQMGIPWTEIISHGKARNSKAFAPQEIQPIQYPEQNLPEGSVSELPEITAPESIVNMFKRGNASFKDMSTSLLLSAGAIGADDAAMALRESARKNRAAAPSVDIQEGMSKIGNAKTFGAAVEEMYNHPVATFTMLADSAYTSIPAIAPALALRRFGPKARGVTAAIGSGISEYSSVLVDVLQSKGIDLLDAERVGRALQDPKILAEIKENGAKRGLIVGTFDGLTMGIAGMFMRPAMKLIAAGKLANQAAKRATVAAWGKELAVQMVGGGGGEFAAQKATGENKPAAVLLEALAEIPLTPLEVRSSLGEARQLEREAGNYDAKRIMEEKGFFPPKTKQPESTLQTPTPPTTPAPPIVKEATPEGTQPPEVSAPGLLKEEDLPLETGTEEVAKQVEVPASGIVPVSQADEATPIVVYHDPIQNMEARVVQMSDGRFSVTMKDLDSGQFLPMAKIFDNLDGANKYAVDIAGPDAVNATINKVIVEPPAIPPVAPAPPPAPPQASVEAEPPAPVTPVVPAVSKPPEATPAAKEPTVTEILNHPIQPKIVGRAMDMSRDQLQKVADAKSVDGTPTSDALLAKEELDLRNKAAEPKVQVGSLVTLQKNGLNGPINIAGTVSRIMLNGELEIRTQNGDIVIRPASEVSVARDPVATPKADIGEPAPKPIKEPVVKILGKNVRSTKMTLKELNRYANGKNADGTPSEASFIAQTELDRRADIKAAKPISPRELARRERLRQQARDRLKIKDTDSLIEAIVKLGGISMKKRQDIIGDTKGNYKIDMVGYLFSRNGTGLDDLATQLHDLGYLSLEEYEDLGGVRSLTEKIQDDWNKERSQHEHFSFGSEEERFKREQEERDEIEQQLIKAQEQEGETSNKKDQQLALSLSDALALMTPKELDELDVLSQTLTDAAWEAEVIKRAQEKIRANQQQNEAGVPAGEEAPQEPRAEGLELQAPTEEELRAEQEARDASEAEAKKKADDEEAKRKEAEDREETKRRSVAAADEFKLTQTDKVTKEKQAELDKKKAEEQLAGQKDLLEKEEEPAYTPQQRKDAEEAADGIGGEISWQKGEYSLIRQYARLTGDPIYIPARGIQTAKVDVSIFAGKQIPDDIKKEMIEAVERLEKEAQKKHEETPFIVFDKDVVTSSGVPEKIAAVVAEWKALLKITANIYISTIEDAKANRNKFTGPHRRIGSGTLNSSELGSTRRMADGSYYILFTKSTSTTKMLEVIAHELGHRHQDVAFENATPEEQKALRDAHEKFILSHKGKKQKDFIHAFRARSAARATKTSGEMLDDSSFRGYWGSFDEWYADQTSRWAMSAKEPQNIVEKYFKKLGIALRKFFQTIKGQGYLPSETFAQYMQNMLNRPADINPPAGDKSSAMQSGINLIGDKRLSEQPPDVRDALAAGFRGKDDTAILWQDMFLNLVEEDVTGQELFDVMSNYDPQENRPIELSMAIGALYSIGLDGITHDDGSNTSFAQSNDESSAMQSGFDFNEEEKRTEAAVKADPVAAKVLHEADAVTGANKKLPPGRSPELAAAAEMVKSGAMPAAKFDELVNRFQPITIYTEPPIPASNEQMSDALDASKREKINPSITTGTLVGLRLDIPAWNRKKVSVISIHTKGTKSGAGYSIGYTNAAKISNATFGLGNQTKALTIAAGVGKDVFQTIEGSWTPTSPDQVYTQAKSALSDPAWTQIGIDPTRHSYAYDRRTTMPVVSAEEILMVGKMVLGKNVTYGKKEDFLFNISSIPPVTAEELESNREEDRKETISRYAGMRRRMQSALVRVGAGEVDLSLQQEVVRLIGASRNLKFFIDTSKPTIVSPEKFLAKALTEFDNGNISAEVLAVIQAAYEKQPELLQGLRLSVKQQDKGGTAGQFFPLNRIVRLFKSTEGTQDPKTIRHEITHSLEQMMGPAQQMAVYDAWLKDLQKAINKNTDEIHKKYFAAVLEFIKNPNRATLEKAQESMPGYDMYQYINPSEYWAVNAERLLGSQLGSAWQRFKMFVRRLFEGLKSVFGFDNKYAIHKTFNQIMSGNKERISKGMLVDLVTGSNADYITLNNIQDDIDLKLQYSRSDTPMIDQNPIRNGLVKGVKIAKEVFVESAKNPIRAAATLGNEANRASIYSRNKNVFFGTGLNLAEQSMYKGALRDSNNMAIASVALDNALRGGIISSEVIMRGGIQWNPNSLNFVAVNKPLGMAGVYKAEGAIKKRAGDQLGTDIVQGYLEAKRSLSINNEFEKRTQDLEDLKNMLINLRGQQSPNPKTIAALKDMINEAKKDLTAITLVKSKVMMGDQQIQDYIAREAVYPELRDIMDNWNAVNQNMLKFWKDVGMISKGRYDVLSKIEDYVPWNRIMDDSEDINSPLQSTTRSMTNIGREKLFKKGVPTVVTKFVAQNGQRNFNIQPASMVNVSVNGTDIPSSGFDVSPDGEVKFANPLSGGDRVVFTTNREIENMIDNMTRNVMRMTMNGLRHYAAVRIVSEFATRDANNRIEVFPKADRDKGRFDFIANGKRIVVEIEDPLIAESIFGMESLDLKMYKYLLGAANLTRRLITLSGAFQIQMVFQDAPTAALVSGVKNPAALFGGVFKGFLTALTGTEPVVDILKRAGIGGFHSPSRTPEAAVKQRLGIMNRDAYQMTMGLLDHLGDSSDMAQRVATYKRVLKETGDEAQALYQAANVINFLHHGSSAQAQFMAKTVPFLGAYANSIDVLAQAAAGGGLKGRDRASAAKRFWITGAALSATTLLYCMMVGDDEEYMKLDDPSKLRSYIVPGTKFVLPMHSSAAFFFKAVPEMLYNKIINEGTNNEVDARRLRRALAEAARDALLGPTLVPSGAKPLVEILLNHDFFTGKAVVPAGLAKVDSADQYVANTSELAKLLGNKVINPIEMDHIIRGMFGSAGAMAQWFSNVTFYGSENRPATTLKEAPILGRFVRPEVPRGREDLFYDLRDQVDSKYQTFTTKLGRLQGEEASKYLNENIDLIKYHKYVSKMGDKLNEVNNAIKLYGTGKLPGITPQERRERIEQFQEIKNIALQNIYTMRKGAGM